MKVEKLTQVVKNVGKTDPNLYKSWTLSKKPTSVKSTLSLKILICQQNVGDNFQLDRCGSNKVGCLKTRTENC